MASWARGPIRRTPPSRRWSPPVRQAAADARQATRDRRWDDAVAAWERARSHLAGQVDADVLAGLASAHRSARRLATAAEIVAEGRAEHPDHLGLLIEDARVSITCYRRSGEDEEHDWKARLLDIEARLHRHRDAGSDSGQLIVVLAELSMALRRWQTAISLWQAVEAEIPHRRVQACVKLAEAYRLRGDLRAAREALERARQSSATRDTRHQDRTLAELRRLGASLGTWTGNELAAHARLRHAVGEHDVAERQLELAFRLKGYTAEQVLALQPVLGELTRLFGEGEALEDGCAAATDADGEHAVTAGVPFEGRPPGVVHVCGFLYSGSGAVLDMLRAHPAVALPFGTREPGFLKKSGNLTTLLEPPVRFDDYPEVVAEAILSGVFGMGVGGRSLFELSGDLMGEDRFLEHTRSLVLAVREAWRDRAGTDTTAIADEVRTALRTYLDGILAAVVSEGEELAVLNNAIVAHRLQDLSLMSQARAVAVFRDPRDQYVSQLLEGAFPLDAPRFVEEMRFRHLEFERLMGTSLGQRVLPVSFESFVRDADVRAGVVSWLGLEPAGQVAEQTFDPGRSKRNIGIHASFADQRSVREVEAALGAVHERLLVMDLRAGSHARDDGAERGPTRSPADGR